MKVFVTGASGFIGTEVVKELIRAGHQVVGLARSEKSANAIIASGAEVLKGNLEDLAILKQAAENADGIIHCGFSHDFMKGGNSSYMDSATMDKNAIQAMGEAIMGTHKSMVVTSGMLGLPLINGLVTEESIAHNSPRSSEATALMLAEKGINASVIRLPPSVHGVGDYGFIPFIIALARKNGISAYPNDGKNQWCAVHHIDAAKAYRLAVEKGERGALYNVVGDHGIDFISIASLIGETLNLPVESVENDRLSQHFEWLSYFVTMNCKASTIKTQERLAWSPTQIGLLEDMRQNYF